MLFVDTIKMFFHDCRLRLIKIMEFRLEFFLGIFTSLGFSLSLPLFQFLVYKTTRGYPGWSFDEIMLFQAIYLLWLGITDTVFGNIKPLMDATIQFGLFDRFLVLPYPPLILIFTKGFNYRSMGTLAAGVIAFIYEVLSMKLVLSLQQVLLFLFFFFSGMLFYISLLILYCTLSLRLIYVLRLADIIDRIMQLANIPADVFSGVIKTIYLSVLPIAIWVNFPARIILGRPDAIAVYSAGSCLMIFLASLCLWKANLKKYASAGG